MTRLHLVRHGRAEAGWEQPDPSLDEVGRRQAEAMGERFADQGPFGLVTSPLARCRETIAVLERRWGRVATVVPAVAELPSPDGYDVSQRVGWLRQAMAGTWSMLDPRYRDYRDQVVATVVELGDRGHDLVIASHFIAINAVIGAALDDDRLVIRSLDNCSITVVEVGREADGKPSFDLIEGGHEADTLIR